MITSLSASQLRRTIDPAELGVQSTASLTPLDGIIGQQRALDALEFGLGMREAGFNVYVAGEPGIGKMTAVRAFLQTQADKQPPAPAWCWFRSISC